MKKSTAFGAVLCSAALAMGMALPAFAAGTPTAETAKDFTPTTDGATATTTVNVTGLNAAQISATIPLNIVVAAPTRGGEITGPTASAYRITNTCSQSIYVNNIKIATASSDYDIATTEAQAQLPENGDELTEGTKGKIYMTVKGNGSTEAIGLKTGGTSIDKSTALGGFWTAQAKDQASNYIDIEVGGNVLPKVKTAGAYGTAGQLDTIPVDSESNFAKITYTIAKVNA